MLCASLIADSGGKYDVEKEEAKVSDQNHMKSPTFSEGIGLQDLSY